jgi:hypothetical protein
MARPAAILVLVLAIPSTALADDVLLRSGHKIVGIQREEKDRIVVETGYGTVAFPRDQVVSVTKGETPMHAWPARYAEIEKSTDARDFTKLAAWARESGMPRYVGGLMRRALELDADNAEARAELGYVRHQGRWITREELRKEQGLVQDGGRWVLPLEKQLAERRRLEAEERKLEREAALKAGEERRRRAQAEAEFQARVKSAEAAPVAVEPRAGRRRGAGILGWGVGGNGGVYDLMLVDWLLAFRNNPGLFPLSSQPTLAQPPPSSGGGLPMPAPPRP